MFSSDMMQSANCYRQVICATIEQSQGHHFTLSYKTSVLTKQLPQHKLLQHSQRHQHQQQQTLALYTRSGRHFHWPKRYTQIV